MYDLETRKRVLALVAQGRSLNSVSRETGVSRHAIRAWQVRLEPLGPQTSCARCDRPATLPCPARDYAYLLGLYLGDGCLSAVPRRAGHVLRIACAKAWPELIDACEAAIRAVHPAGSVCRVQRQGDVCVTSYSRHWTCLFPQHGPGRKHERRIALEAWQREVVEAYTWEFVRGLVHSDGSRCVNWTERVVGGERKRYTYARYFFTNRSADIRGLYTAALDRLGVQWRQANAWNVSVARRGAVALMERFVGPKG